MQLVSPFCVKKCLILAVTLAVGSHLWCGLAAGESASSSAMSASSPGRIRSKQTAQEPRVAPHQRAGYLAEKASFLGTIYHAMGEPHFLRRGDLALIDVGANRDLKVGDHLTVFRFLPTVRHPPTDSVSGKPVRIMVDAIVPKVNDTTAMIRITLAFDEMEVGNRVERFGALQAEPRARLIERQSEAAERFRAASARIEKAEMQPRRRGDGHGRRNLLGTGLGQIGSR